MEIYRVLFETFGHRRWWPAKTPFEVILGAILTQNTSWSNVEKALANLKAAKVFSVKRLREIPESDLAALIRSSGYFNQKAKKIKAFLAFLDKHYGGSIAEMSRAPLETLRPALLEVNGIGPETADSILHYALGKKVFVVDAYTRRIFARHYYFEPDPSYDEVQSRFEGELPDDLDLYNDFHAQIVAVGNRFCKPKPRCEGCPLERFPHRLD